MVCLLAAPASAGWIQGAAGAREAGSRAHDAHQAAPVSGPDARGQAAHSAPERHGETGAHAESPWATVARLVNFGVLVGVLVYFLRAPVARYFAGRREAIAGALAAAAADRQRADALLAEVEARRRALPGEIEALRARAA
ncbi:MAG TPA: hypothetical protein VNI83_07380, partial [Vicinamibacterales bacterium]|nr:hypothetical protein [Vicinamibacterales bacterium]